MILVFIDETGDSRDTQYFGLCCAVINSFFYPSLKRSFHDLISTSGWNPNIEFKGKYLFSISQGDPAISVDDRITLTGSILGLCESQSNSRVSMGYASANHANHNEAYLEILPRLLGKVLRKAGKGAGKDALLIVCDTRYGITSKDIHAVIADVLKAKGYTLVEYPLMTISGYETVGIMLADIVGYLSCRIDTIQNDADLFERFDDVQLKTHPRIRKLSKSIDLLDKVRKIKRIVT